MCLCNLFNDSSTLFLLIAALILIWYFSSCQNGGAGSCQGPCGQGSCGQGCGNGAMPF
ncbi:MAG: hypothetical protein J5849_02030 [Clostridia bacterium]|nr:hypothetical protein [Clostridia bacterium]MBR5743523.1 hypothetical protein [Clostridia bacterium]